MILAARAQCSIVERGGLDTLSLDRASCWYAGAKSRDPCAPRSRDVTTPDRTRRRCEALQRVSPGARALQSSQRSRTVLRILVGAVDLGRRAGDNLCHLARNLQGGNDLIEVAAVFVVLGMMHKARLPLCAPQHRGSSDFRLRWVGRPRAGVRSKSVRSSFSSNWTTSGQSAFRFIASRCPSELPDSTSAPDPQAEGG